MPAELAVGGRFERPRKPTATPTAVPVPEGAYAAGTLDIAQGERVDLDRGALVGPNGAADFWRHASGDPAGSITALNGARLARVFADSLSPDACVGATYRAADAGIGVTEAPRGSYICVRTNEGRTSVFRVEEPASSGTLSNADGSNVTRITNSPGVDGGASWGP